GPLLDSYPEMDALFVGNDQMALGVLHVACREGIRVPQDLALVGFDGIPEAAYYWPPLTTVYQDQPELGRTAVRELSHIVEASHQQEESIDPVTLTLQPELLVRQSSAARQAAGN
ncbi:MAG: substrate-binding domain-containing protein, partial [Candidatus Brocadiia bacterium]